MDSFAPPPPTPSSPPPPPSTVAFRPYSGILASPSRPTSRSPPPPPSSSSSSSSLQSVLIIAGIIAVCALASISIFCLLRFLSIHRRRRHRRSSSSVAALPLPLVHRRSSSAVTDSSAATVSSCEAATPALSEKEKVALIQSLPLFSLASSVSAQPKSSPDCAVCLSPFLSADDLRLLPACRHAFHASCIEKWFLAGDTPSCPLCRASVTLYLPPSLPETVPPAAISAGERSRSGSFRIEIGSVSLRRAPPSGEPGNPNIRPQPPSLPPAVRTYSIDSEWDYLVEEELEAVLTEKSEKPSEAGAPVATAAAPVGQQQAAVAGSGRSSRWLRDYVDRLSSASSSLRFSGRWSNRYDSSDAAAVVRQPSWHWEGSARREAAEDGGILGFYRWLVGAY